MKISDFSIFLFDIEGTVVPVSFVHDVLFPYSKEKMGEYILTNQLPENTLERIFIENSSDFAENKFGTDLQKVPSEILKKEISSYLLYLISVDRKSNPLKEIQGKIWKTGYESGKLQSTVFPDVPEFFKRIAGLKKRISIYSSGSVEAQKLIFKYSKSGDMTGFISSYFDTSVGGKKDKQSYLKIAEELNAPPERIIFFTDINEEAESAIAAGFEAIILDRPGNAPQPDHSLTKIPDFSGLLN
ncbi:MAG: acireductone synthase [Leptospira sp.]|nr:acireductone synthase [Leptospira sp.]